ncbi:hypothetical protein FA95DRAFT_1681363 [Auriscalpium vulgare]|uniref:Uncharacterized protein n=1 Tax=Auriscalpium vulgare TaxID=40419 RepID=A0ACB8RKC6_9AGAM|nr:hypothetical protein FA95DRAFT_1681363 [Auriscalpium vulgare]
MGDSYANITVHELVSVPRDTRPTVNNAALVLRGRALASAGCESNGWTSVRPLKRFISIASSSTGRTYVFAQQPPRVQPSTVSPVIAQWGELPQPDEMLSIEDMVPFESSDFRKLSLLIDPPRQRPLESPSPEPRPAKRLKQNKRPLHSIIPLPHYHRSAPSSFTASPSSPIVDYAEAPTVPVPPHSDATVANALMSPYSRVTWVVPVRGMSPWNGATGASVDDSARLPKPCAPCTSSLFADGLCWTPSALDAFWVYLLRLVQQPTALAPVSISFHAAPARSGDATLSTPQLNQSTSTLLSAAVSRELRPALLETDHIKVYCDAPRALAVRNVIDAWKYDAGDTGAGRSPVHVLKRARLVLVDWKAEGVLIS